MSLAYVLVAVWLLRSGWDGLDAQVRKRGADTSGEARGEVWGEERGERSEAEGKGVSETREREAVVERGGHDCFCLAMQVSHLFSCPAYRNEF